MILVVVAALVACFAIGTWAWRLPGIGLSGSLGGYAPGWLVVFGATVTALVLRGDPSGGAWITGALGVFSAVSGLFFAWDQWRVLRRHGVRARWWDFFALVPRSATGPDVTVQYGRVAGRSPAMAVFRPRGDGTAAPTVFHIHGGAWADGNEASDRAFCRALSDRGFVVFSATYTLADESTPTWNIAPRELAAAMAAAAHRANEFGGSADQFFVTGSSAGGHLAALVANASARVTNSAPRSSGSRRFALWRSTSQPSTRASTIRTGCQTAWPAGSGRRSPAGHPTRSPTVMPRSARRTGCTPPHRRRS